MGIYACVWVSDDDGKYSDGRDDDIADEYAGYVAWM